MEDQDNNAAAQERLHLSVLRLLPGGETVFAVAKLEKDFEALKDERSRLFGNWFELIGAVKDLLKSNNDTVFSQRLEDLEMTYNRQQPTIPIVKDPS